MDKDLQIIHGDCLEIMKGMADKSVDLVLTDPPYGMEYTRHISNPKFGKIENDNNLDWLPIFLQETSRILKDSGSMYVFCSWHNIEVFKTEINKVFTVRNMLIWDKEGMGMGDLETTYGGTYEICLFANKTPQKLNGSRNRDVLKQQRTGNELHPTQKPVDLISFLIEKSSNENDLILDPFAGSCTTLIACNQLNRRCICIEKEEDYVKICHERLGATSNSLFQ